jgi:hypothetical protein
LYFWVAVPFEVDLQLVQSFGMLEVEGVQVPDDGMIGNFCDIVLTLSINPELLDLSEFQFIVFAVLVHFALFLSISILDNVVVLVIFDGYL